MNLRAVYAGSFDPPTLGHLNIVGRALSFCDEVFMSVGINPQKKTLFSDAERMLILTNSIVEGLGPIAAQRVYVSNYDGLLVDYAKKYNIKLIIRGARTLADYEYENSLALINKKLAPEIETVILPADPELSIVSSSMVKEVAKFNGDVSSFVTPVVLKYLKEKFPHV